MEAAINELKKFNKELFDSGKKAKESSGFIGLLKNNYLNLSSAFRDVSAGLKYIIDETVRSQKVHSQLEAVLKSTGHAAGITSEEIIKMADELKGLTAIDEDVIISGQNLLLTFTRIGKEIFPEATSAMLNMSVALGQDVRQSAIQLGKALNDPVQGVTALRRVGIQLTETQQQQIKKFMTLNDVVSAQKVILGELETQMGGSAAAQANNLGGSMNKLSNAMGDVAKVIGNVLAPDIQKFANLLRDISSYSSMIGLNKLLTWAWEFGKAISRVVVGVATIGASEIYNAYKYITDKGTSAAGAVIGVGIKEAKPWKTPEASGVDQKLLEEQKKALDQYNAYLQGSLAKAMFQEQQHYNEALKYAQQHGLNVEEIERQHQENLLTIKAEGFQKQLNVFTQFAQQTMGQLNQIFQMQSQNELQRLNESYNKKKMFANFFITDEKTRNVAIQAIDFQMEMHKNQLARREFEREKAVKIATTIINTAAAAASVYAAFAAIPYVGTVMAPIMAAIVSAFGASQIAIIAAQQAPAMAAGGLIQGSRAGSLIRAGEGGRSEAIIPFDNPEAMSRLGGFGGNTYHVHFDGAILANEDLPNDFVRALDRGLYKLKQRRDSVFAS
jgi:hypothetical protein